MDELLQISRLSLEYAAANSGSYVALCTHLLAIFAAWKLVWFLVGVWVFYVARRFEAGLRRGLACLPAVVVLLNATPVLVDRCSMPLLIVPFMAMLSLSSFKVRVLPEAWEWIHTSASSAGSIAVRDPAAMHCCHGLA